MRRRGRASHEWGLKPIVHAIVRGQTHFQAYMIGV
jgi:hypothetical protein